MADQDPIETLFAALSHGTFNDGAAFEAYLAARRALDELIRRRDLERRRDALGCTVEHRPPIGAVDHSIIILTLNGPAYGQGPDYWKALEAALIAALAE